MCGGCSSFVQYVLDHECCIFGNIYLSIIRYSEDRTDLHLKFIQFLYAAYPHTLRGVLYKIFPPFFVLDPMYLRLVLNLMTLYT